MGGLRLALSWHRPAAQPFWSPWVDQALQSWAATGRAAVLVIAATVAVTFAGVSVTTLEQAISSLSGEATAPLH
jgi:hypothetical protein